MLENSTSIEQKPEGNRTEWSSSSGEKLSPGGKNADLNNVDVAGSSAGVSEAAHEYTDKLSDAVTQAKDYVGDKVSIVSGKIKEFASNDLSSLPRKAKDFARGNPGQAILISAAAGVLLGLIVRGRR